MNKLDLGGVAAAPKSARPSHPTITADANTDALLVQFAAVDPQFKTLKNQRDTLAKQLAAPIKSMFFSLWNGRQPESSTMLVTAGGRTIKLTVKNAYSSGVTNEAALYQAIGKELTDEWFAQSTTLALDLDVIAEDKRGAFAMAVIALRDEMGLPQECVAAKQCIKPRAGFHEARTSILSAAQNIALDEIMPVVAYPQL